MDRTQIPRITVDAASVTTADTEASWNAGDDAGARPSTSASEDRPSMTLERAHDVDSVSSSHADDGPAQLPAAGGEVERVQTREDEAPPSKRDSTPREGRISRFFHRKSVPPDSPPPLSPPPGASSSKKPFFKKRLSRQSDASEQRFSTHAIITDGLPSPTPSQELSPTSEKSNRFSLASPKGRERSGSKSLSADLASHPSVARRLSDVEATPESRAIALLSLDPSLSPPSAPASPTLTSHSPSSPPRDHPSSSAAFSPTRAQCALLPNPEYDPMTEPPESVMQLAGRLHSSSRTGVSFAKQRRHHRPLTRLFSHGASTVGDDEDPDPALSLSTMLFGVLAESRNHRPAKVMYGLAVRCGWGCVPNEAEGLRWLREAASGALAHTNDEGPQREAGEDGDRAELQLALYEVANGYAFGIGVEKDAARALEYYEIAGTLGDTDSLNALGDAWYNGNPLPKGSKKSKFQAAQWYRKAEKLGGQPILGNQWIWKDKYDPLPPQ